MRLSRVCERTLGISLLALGMSLAAGPNALADPADTADPGATGPAPAASLPPVIAPAGDTNPATAEACKKFSAALNYAATNYEDFAYATAGNGNTVNYRDPQISDSNIVGRTALREAAGVALSASGTPGLPPEIANPMRKWSMNAARLLLTMGLHGGGDALNSAAASLNNDAHDAQLACASAGTSA